MTVDTLGKLLAGRVYCSFLNGRGKEMNNILFLPYLVDFKSG